MIDFENEIFDDVSKAMQAKHPSLLLYSDVVPRPASLPCVMLVQIENRIATNAIDSSHEETHVDVEFQADVYSNKKTGRRQECKALMADLCDAMAANGAVRSMLGVTPNPDDDTVYRMTARWDLRLRKDGTRFRR